MGGTSDLDAQDPLPESGFFYRRVTVWVVSITILGLLWFNVHSLRALEHGDGLVEISKWLIVLLALILTYYLIAPSAEHIVRMVQTVGAWKSGIATSATTVAKSLTVEQTPQKTEVKTEEGKLPWPPK